MLTIFFYFNHPITYYIGCEELLEHVLVKMLNYSLAESLFGHMSELTAGNNLTYLQMARFILRETFHYLLVALTSAENSSVSVKRARNEKPGKYFYSTIDDSGEDDQSRLLWMFTMLAMKCFALKTL